MVRPLDSCRPGKVSQMAGGGTTPTFCLLLARVWRLRSQEHGTDGGTNKLWDPRCFPLTCQVDHKLTLLKLRLVRLSMDQKDALTVLLTGRGEANFAPIIKRMAASQQLDFDLIGLKPEVGPNGQQFASTMMFKQKFLEDLVYTYDQADEIRIYEDRVKQYVFFPLGSLVS